MKLGRFLFGRLGCAYSNLVKPVSVCLEFWFQNTAFNRMGKLPRGRGTWTGLLSKAE